MRLKITSLLIMSQFAAIASAQPLGSASCAGEDVSVSAMSIDVMRDGSVVYEGDVRIELQGLILRTRELRMVSVENISSQQSRAPERVSGSRWCNPDYARFETGELEVRGETLRVLSGGVTLSLDGAIFEAEEVVIVTERASS